VPNQLNHAKLRLAQGFMFCPDSWKPHQLIDIVKKCKDKPITEF
jgi:hypothetical protein